MQYIGITVGLTAHLKANLLIKTNCMHLRRQPRMTDFQLLANLYGLQQQGLSYTLPTPRCEHGHAANMPVRQDSGTCQELITLAGQQMNRSCISGIPFQVHRHVLLIDEDHLPDMSALRPQGMMHIQSMDTELNTLHGHRHSGSNIAIVPVLQL
jgi:hypothetical protein